MNLLRALSSVFFPFRCAGCGEVLSDEEEFVCAQCLGVLPVTEEAWHRGNKLEMLFRSFAPYMQEESKTANKFIRGAAYTYYRNSVPNIIHTMKFTGDPKLARWMGKRAAQALSNNNSSFFEGIDLLMPVALHPRRLQERGFNQSEWICMGISEVTGIPIDTNHLVRTVYTDQQSRKTLEERATLGSVFSVINPNELIGKHVLIVDDVVTTGTTIKRVLEVLHPIRRCTYSVFGMTFAVH